MTTNNMPLDDELKGKHLNIQYDQLHDVWICNFTSKTTDGQIVHRQITCKTKDELVRRMSGVKIDSGT